jgi:hypothetical protein
VIQERREAWNVGVVPVRNSTGQRWSDNNPRLRMRSGKSIQDLDMLGYRAVGWHQYLVGSALVADKVGKDGTDEHMYVSKGGKGTIKDGLFGAAD